MENYKKKINRRIVWLGITVAIIALIQLALMFLSQTERIINIPDFIEGYQLGFFASIELVIVVTIVKQRTALKNEEALKKLYIKEHDERTIYILQRSGSTGYYLIVIGLAIGVIIAGYFSRTVFVTLIGALLFVCVINVVLKLYYRNKY